MTCSLSGVLAGETKLTLSPGLSLGGMTVAGRGKARSIDAYFAAARARCSSAQVTFL
jgi:hypothetical protein